MIDATTAFELVSLTQVLDKRVRDKFLISLIENAYLDLFELRGKEPNINLGRGYVNYIIDGKYHKLNGPARETFYDNENKMLYEHNWYFSNMRHRMDGPAYISFDKNGAISNKGYYMLGQAYDENKYFETIAR